MRTQDRRFISSLLILLAGLSMVAGGLRAQPASVPDPSVPAFLARNDRFGPMHESFLERAKAGPVGLLFLGDSITAGWTKKAPDIWEKYFGAHQPANFGIGSDNTMGVLWRIEHGELDHIKPKVLVLLLGTNNTNMHTAPQISAGLGAVVRRIRAKLPETRILLLAILPRGPRPDPGDVPDDSGRRMEIIHAVNADLAKLADGRHVRFLDVGSLFLDANGRIRDDLMPDRLHPNPAGYEVWAAAMKPVLDEMMR